MTLDELKFDGAGLIPVCILDARTGRLLTLAYANREALERTIASQETHLWSRSRGKLWRKGEESGNVQEVREIFVDCDADTILLKVHQIGGAACHEGFASCFFRKLDNGELKTIGERLFDPKQVYKK